MTDRAPSGPWSRRGDLELGPWAGYIWARAGEQLARLMPDSIVSPVVDGIARGYRILSRRRMIMIQKHLEMACPDLSAAELEVKVERALHLYARYWLETFRANGYKPAEFAATVTTEGEEHLREAYATGSGAIVACPHLGNWDAVGAYSAQHYGTLLTVAELLKPNAAFNYWCRSRERLGIRVVALDGTTTPAREVIAWLRGGGIVALIADRDLTGDGIEVDFFGERTTVPGGPATFAVRTGAPLLPLGSYVDDAGKTRVVLRPPIEIDGECGKTQAVATATQSLVNEFERLIRIEPEQWHLFTPNWPSDWVALGEKSPVKASRS